jgi:hypothetical protein
VPKPAEPEDQASRRGVCDIDEEFEIDLTI